MSKIVKIRPFKMFEPNISSYRVFYGLSENHKIIEKLNKVIAILKGQAPTSSSQGHTALPPLYGGGLTVYIPYSGKFALC